MNRLLTFGLALLAILLGLPVLAAVVVTMSTQSADCSLRAGGCGADTVSPITLGTLNLLGAGHTDGKPGGGAEKPSFSGWQKRLPEAMKTLETAGVTIAGLQEVHPPQARALARQHAMTWGMYPVEGHEQNRVVWDRSAWRLTDARLVQIPYFGDRARPGAQSSTSTVLGSR